MSDESTPFDPFPARELAFNDLVRAVGEYKLKAAQAALEEATAAQERTRVNILQTLLEQLQQDLYTLNAARSLVAHKVEFLTSQAHSAGMLLQGMQIAAYGHARDAYKYFEKQALIEGDDSLFREVFTGITGDQFINNNNTTLKCDDPPLQLNALQLMDWALNKQYIARAGSLAQFHFVKIFREIAQVAQAALDNIRKTFNEIHRETYDVWQPIKIIDANPNPVEQRILQSVIPLGQMVNTISYL